MGHLARLPAGRDIDPQEVAAPVSLPAELSDLELLETPLARFGGVPMGVVFDRRAHTYTSTVRCEARAFYLLGQDEREDFHAEVDSGLGCPGDGVRPRGVRRWWRRGRARGVGVAHSFDAR